MHFHLLLTGELKDYVQEPKAGAIPSHSNIQQAIYNAVTGTKPVTDEATTALMERVRGFSLAVEELVNSTMEPYGSDSEAYFEFVDMTDSLKREYAERKLDCFILPEGRIVNQYDKAVWKKFKILDGRVAQISTGKMKNPKRTHKAKKIKPLLGYPVNKLYKTFDDYVREYSGEEYNEEYMAYGYCCNPNARWDWFQIGGRWPTTFLVKDTCKEFSFGERSWCNASKKDPVPEGYLWVSAARKKDIQWEAMKAWHRKEAEEAYQKMVETYVAGTLNPDPHLSVKDGWVYEYIHKVYRIGEPLEEFLERCSMNAPENYSVSFCDIIDEDDWRTEPGVGWCCDRNSEESQKWTKEIQAYIDNLDDDAVLVSVDYHM